MSNPTGKPTTAKAILDALHYRMLAHKPRTDQAITSAIADTLEEALQAIEDGKTVEEVRADLGKRCR